MISRNEISRQKSASKTAFLFILFLAASLLFPISLLQAQGELPPPSLERAADDPQIFVEGERVEISQLQSRRAQSAGVWNANEPIGAPVLELFRNSFSYIGDSFSSLTYALINGGQVAGLPARLATTQALSFSSQRLALVGEAILPARQTYTVPQVYPAETNRLAQRNQPRFDDIELSAENLNVQLDDVAVGRQNPFAPIEVDNSGAVAGAMTQGNQSASSSSSWLVGVASALGGFVEDGIVKFRTLFANRVETSELCLDDTCVTESELKDLLAQ